MLIAAADLIIACWRRLRLFRKKKVHLGFSFYQISLCSFVAN